MAEGARAAVPQSTLWTYGLPNLAISVAQIPTAIYLQNLYAGELAVPLGLVTLALLLSRLTDVITDPLVGILSDEVTTRWGRRKPWIAAGVPLMAGALWMLFVPPEGAGFWWLLIAVSLFYLGNTIVDLPYRSWGADLSQNYAERSRVAGVREALGLVGTLLSLVIPVVMAVGFGQTRTSDWTFGIAVAFAVLLPLLAIPALLAVPEPPRETAGRRTTWRRGLMIVLRNGPFMRLAVMGMVFFVSLSMTAALSQFFVIHVLGAPRQYPLIILCYYLAAFLAIPVWLRIGDRIGKHRALMWAILWLALWSAPIPFIGQGAFWPFFALMVLKGTAIGAILLLPASMAADITDLDTLRSGQQRTGLYFAIWGMLFKAAAMLGTSIGMWGIDLAGFDPGCASIGAAVEAASAAGTCTNSGASLFWLAAFYSLIPAIIACACAPALWRYPIDEARQRRLRALIARRNRALGRADGPPGVQPAADLV